MKNLLERAYKLAHRLVSWLNPLHCCCRCGCCKKSWKRL